MSPKKKHAMRAEHRESPWRAGRRAFRNPRTERYADRLQIFRERLREWPWPKTAEHTLEVWRQTLGCVA